MVRVSERLAIVDEINDDAGHELAIAAIQMSFGRATPQSALEALEVGLAACQRSLEGMRRVRRMLGDAAGPPHDSEPVPEEVARLHVLADASGATLHVDRDLPGAAEFAVGLLLTVFRAVEALLRFTAGSGAEVEIRCDDRCLHVRVECEREAASWVRPDPDVERVRERLRWFDGRLHVEPTARGSRAAVALPL